MSTKSWKATRRRVESIAAAGFCALCAITCFVALFRTRSSFIDGRRVVSHLQDYPYVYSSRINLEYYDPTTDVPGIQSLQTIEESADVIATASFSGVREPGQFAVISTLTILDSFKGHASPGDQIRLIEPIRIEQTADDASGETCTLYADGNYANGFLPLENGRSYLMFLQIVKPPTIEGMSQRQTPTYAIFNSPYSRLLIQGDVQVASPEGDDRTLRLRELAGMNVMIAAPGAEQLYSRTVEDIFARYRIAV